MMGPAERKGVWFGVVTALSGGIYFTLARAGIVGGVGPEEMALFRSGIAGLLLLPVLLHHGLFDLAGIGWRRGLALMLTAGPAFPLLQTGGYLYAPLAHGAVITAGGVTMFSLLLSMLALRERPSRARILGTVLMLLGLGVLGWDGIAHGTGAMMWLGDLMFLAAALIWASYTVLLRIWRLDAVRGGAVASVLSLALVAPIYFLLFGTARLAALPTQSLMLQAVTQGLIAGVILVLAYGRAVMLLGPARAGLFPSLVPALSILLGIPVLGEFPGIAQIVGLAIVTAGILIGLELTSRRATP